MPGIYDEDERKKREKDVARPAGNGGLPYGATDSPVDFSRPQKPSAAIQAKAADISRPAVKFTPGQQSVREAFGEAAREETQGAMFGKGLKAVTKIPGAIASDVIGAFREPAEAVGGFVKEAARGLAGAPKVEEDITRPQPETGGKGGTIRLPSGEIISTEGRSREDIMRQVSGQPGEVAAQPETGQEFTFTLPSGEEVTSRGKNREEAMQAMRAEAGGRGGEMVYSHGGYNLPKREAAEEVYRPEKLSDVAAPRTMGDLMRYRREVEAKKFDIGQAGEAEQQRVAIEQADADRKAREASGEQDAGLAERGMKLKETQAAGEASRQEAEASAQQAQQAQFSEAQQAFEAAGSVEEKVAAANRMRMLKGEAPEVKSPESTSMSEAEASKASQSAYKSYAETGGDPADFHKNFFSTDPTAWRRIYGSMAPNEVKNYDEFMNLTPEKKEAKVKQFNTSANENLSVSDYMKELDKQYKAARKV